MDPKYIREAHKLLKTSIINVEGGDDVVLDDDDEDANDGMANQGGGNDNDNDDGDGNLMERDSASGRNSGNVNEDGETHLEHLQQLIDSNGTGEGVRQSMDADESAYDDQNIGQGDETLHRKQTVVTREKFEEIWMMIGRHLTAQKDKGQNGVRWGDIVDWYLLQREEEITTLDAINAEENIVNKVSRIDSRCKRKAPSCDFHRVLSGRISNRLFESAIKKSENLSSFQEPQRTFPTKKKYWRSTQILICAEASSAANHRINYFRCLRSPADE